MSSFDTKWLKPFLAGVIATAATSHLIIPKLLSKRDDNTNTHSKQHSHSHSHATKSQYQSNSRSTPKSQNSTLATSSVSSSSSQTLMDSPTLDQRLIRKAEGALQGRTSRLIVVVERCTNDHNYSAILRTAEALGIQHIYIIDPQACNSTLKKDGDVHTNETNVDENDTNMKLFRSTGQAVKQCTDAEVKDRAQHHLFAQRAVEWLEVKEFQTTRDCIDALRKDGYHIWSTDLSQVAVCLTRDELLENQQENQKDDLHVNVIPEKLAIVFGTEAVGCTAEMLNASDKRVYLPLRGFADSLNLSVATALVIHQLFTLDPTLVGSMPDNERIELRRKWYSKLASQRLLSRHEKTRRRKLICQINHFEKAEWKANHPEESGGTPLQEEQKRNLEKLPSLRAELQKINDELQEKSLRAIEDLVLNPPQPLGDMRRADEHRATYVGKNTKRNVGQNWKDMPATGYYRSEQNSCASFFQDRLKEGDK